MPHCSQGIQWSLKVQLLIKEYLFKIMLDFHKEYCSCSNDYSVKSHCTFFQKHHPLSKGLLYIYIYTHMKRFPVVQELNKSKTLSQGLLCVLKATFSKECHTLLKAILCIHVKLLTYFKNILYGELCYFKLLFFLQMNVVSFVEGRLPNTIVQANIFHEVIKFKGMPHS